MLHSLRTRLVVGVVGAVVLFLCVSAIALYTAVATSLTNEFDAVLGSKARILSIMVVEGNDEGGEWYKLVYERVHFQEYEEGPAAEYFLVRRPDGSVLQRSPSLGRGDLPHIFGSLTHPATADFTLPDGRPGRIAGIHFIPRREDGLQPEPSPDREMTLVVAQATDALQGRLMRFGWLLVAVFTGATLFAALALSGVIAALVRPLRDLARRLDALGADDLSARFADVRWVEELRPVADRLDDLFLRLDAAFRRERAFTADVAHELRTPLAGLRATIDVTLRQPREGVEYRTAMASCHDQIDRLQALVATLLSLAQIEGGRLRIEREPVVLASLVQECWQPHGRVAGERQVTTTFHLDTAVIAEADRTQARIIIANLVDNAISYVEPGGVITLTVTAQPTQCVVEVSNTGYAGDQDAVEQLFDRFARGDRARSDDQHCGLGLALARRLARLLDGDLRATAVDGRFCITLSLPLAQLPDETDVA